MAGRPSTKQAPPFGIHIAKLRQARGWTQPELAERLGSTVKTVAYYEREAANPTAKTIERFAVAFGVPVTELIEATHGERKLAKPGPVSKIEQLTERLAKLPRAKQKAVTDMLEGYLDRAS